MINFQEERRALRLRPQRVPDRSWTIEQGWPELRATPATGLDIITAKSGTSHESRLLSVRMRSGLRHIPAEAAWDLFRVRMAIAVSESRCDLSGTSCVSALRCKQ